VAEEGVTGDHCTRCGYENSTDSRYCTQCGAQLTASADALVSFVLTMQDLRRRAALPSFRKIAQQVIERSDLPGTASHETVAKLLKGETLATWPVVEAVATVLVEWAGDYADPTHFLTELKQLWTLVRAGEPAASGTQNLRIPEAVKRRAEYFLPNFAISNTLAFSTVTLDFLLRISLPTIAPGEALFVVAAGQSQGAVVGVASEPVVFGRSPDADVPIDDIAVSRQHARVIQTPDSRHLLEDLGSLNGTYLNRAKISTPEPLATGDEVQFGAIRLIYTRTCAAEHLFLEASRKANL
jgi:hypothetical protein